MCFSGSFPVSAKNAFRSALMAVSMLTCALSFFVSDTYPRLQIFWLDAAATIKAGDGLKRPADEADFFKQSCEACLNEVEAIFDIVVVF